jgi:hypothetical protein
MFLDWVVLFYGNMLWWWHQPTAPLFPANTEVLFQPLNLLNLRRWLILRTKITDAEREIANANQNTFPLSHRLEDLLLVSQCRYSDQPLPGISPHERLLNRQRTYDEHVYRRLFTGDVDPDVVMQDEVQLRSAVPARTELLDVYLGHILGSTHSTQAPKG